MRVKEAGCRNVYVYIEIKYIGNWDNNIFGRTFNLWEV